MQFDDQRVDTSRVHDRRDGGGGGFGSGGGGLGGAGAAATASILAQLLRGKGGKGALGMMLLVGLVLVGMNLLSGGLPGTGQQAAVAPAEGTRGDLAERCNEPGAIDQYPDCLIVKVFDEADEVWSAEFARLGQEYRPPSLTFFDGSVDTACGPATTAVGPFYCPGDESIYFDLGFADELARLGVKGDYANAYIVAHEFGHHLQNITGIEQQVRQAQGQDRANANKYGVKMELQADCFAGAWGRLANDRGNVTVDNQDVRDAMQAAQAVGDDRIQEAAGQRVNPETWTHGSASQRQQWYGVGYNSGDINRCNTFQSA